MNQLLDLLIFEVLELGEFVPEDADPLSDRELLRVNELFLLDNFFLCPLIINIDISFGTGNK